MVIACAAFCMPISMTNVRRSLVEQRKSQAINAPHEVVARMSASIENTLLELPLGLHATSIIPMINNGERLVVSGERMMSHATSGSRIICPKRPINTGFGRVATNLKSAGLSTNPKSNISKVNIGSTINIVFITYLLYWASTFTNDYLCFTFADAR